MSEMAVGDNHDAADPITQCVRAAWASALGQSDFSDDDDFYRLGGHSMKAMQVVRRLSADLRVRVPARAVLEHATVRALAANLQALVQAGASR